MYDYVSSHVGAYGNVGVVSVLMVIDVHSSGQQEASSFAQMCASPPSLTTYAEAELLTNSLVRKMYHAVVDCCVFLATLLLPCMLMLSS